MAPTRTVVSTPPFAAPWLVTACVGVGEWVGVYEGACADGASVGNVGARVVVGAAVPPGAGLTVVGARVGAAVGAAVGPAVVGARVEPIAMVGLFVCNMGVREGVRVGAYVGVGVGVRVGPYVGAAVGTLVGAHVCWHVSPHVQRNPDMMATRSSGDTPVALSVRANADVVVHNPDMVPQLRGTDEGQSDSSGARRGSVNDIASAVSLSVQSHTVGAGVGDGV